jgi:hypothetical protein
VNPWDRFPDETREEHAAFVSWLLAPRRRPAPVPDRRWWTQRRDAWEAHLLATRLEITRAQALEVQEARAAALRTVRRATAMTERTLERLEAAPLDLSDVAALGRAATTALDVAERCAAMAPAPVTEDGPARGALTDEQLEAITRILEGP